MKRHERIPYLAVVAGEVSALTLLAPMEWATARYVGAPGWAAWTVTGLVYSVAVLAIWTSRLVYAALGLVWVSGAVGVLHAAAQQAAAEKVPMDQARAVTSLAVVTIVVLAMAAVWYLGQIHRAEVAAARAAEQDRKNQAAAAARAAEERAAQAAREHELALRRAAQDAAEATARRQAEAAEQWARQEAQTRAQREAERAAEHARQLELLRAQTETQHPQRAQRADQRRPAQASRKTVMRRPAAGPQTDSELQRRATVKEQTLAALRRGEDVENRVFAVAYYGVAEPTAKELAAARANLSTWKRSIAAQAQDTAESAAEETADELGTGTDGAAQ